jgi:hypothetical protein
MHVALRENVELGFYIQPKLAPRHDNHYRHATTDLAADLRAALA